MHKSGHKTETPLTYIYLYSNVTQSAVCCVYVCVCVHVCVCVCACVFFLIFLFHSDRYGKRAVSVKPGKSHALEMSYAVGKDITNLEGRLELH